ncbi:MAG: metallophosphoesterase [Rhodanobacteraceae bacterium]|nr:metallophosphoesterase [Rhodanobacteraceae bacterium]
MKLRTVIVSDLHLGGGSADPGDDHVYQQHQFRRFLDELSGSEEAARGEIELFINGDFLEFAQTAPDAYEGVDKSFWCSERESCLKLEVVLAGHRDIFDALGMLASGGNTVTLAAGNHDVDLYWAGVQQRLRAATHATLQFELGKEWVGRYDERLQIAHGHIPDPVNTFKNWADPRRFDADREERLEMCPGTLFMLQFVNRMERKYPFADNLHPVQSLARLLYADDKSGFTAMGWAFLRFAARNPRTLGQTGADPGVGTRLLRRLRDPADPLAAALGDALPSPLAAQVLRDSLRSEDALAEFIVRNWPHLAGTPAALQLDARGAATLSASARRNTLAALAQGSSFGKDALRRVARERAASVPQAEVIVLGHTHVPDELQVSNPARYFNPGSWTRYVDVEQHPELSLDDLRDESRFPYALNFVDVRCLGAGQPLQATLSCFDQQAAEFSG